MSTKPLSRRTVLRGAGGVTLALPILEAMVDGRKAHAQTAQVRKKLVICFSGHSIGTGSPAGGPAAHLVPTGTGPGYDLTNRMSLAPIKQANLQQYVTVVSKLRIPWTASGATPAGGWSGDFHTNAVMPLLSGQKMGTPRAPSADQIAAKVLEPPGRLPLALRVQASPYGIGGAGTFKGVMSYRQNSDGTVSAHNPIVSPDGLWNSLFKDLQAPTGGSAPPAGPGPEPRARAAVVDLVRERTKQLMSRVGAADRIRIDQHLGEVSQLEARIREQQDVKPSVGCTKPPAPGDDPAIGGSIKVAPGPDGFDWSGNRGWSDETLRAERMTDYLRLACACGFNRTATLMLTMFQSWMNVASILGTTVGPGADIHKITHIGGTTQNLPKIIAWHVGWFARLVSSFKGTLDVDGSSLLDNTVLLMIFEGGHGAHPEQFGGATFGPHSTEDMCVLLAGGSSSRMKGLKLGHHIFASGAQNSPVNVMISALDALGVWADGQPRRMGDVEGVMPALFG